MDHTALSPQRKAQIEDTLLALMARIPYEQITVKDIADTLHIARKTFYHYFPSKTACLESLADRLIYGCSLAEMQTLPPEPPVRDVYALRIRYWMAHKNFLDAINRNALGAFLLERFLQYLRQEDKALHQKLSRPHMKMDEDILFFYMSSQLFLLLKWCYDGFPLSVEEMVRKLLRLSHEPLLPPEM